jgi:hypothetical protein
MLALQNSMRQHLESGSFEWIVADNRSDENLSEKLSDAIYIRMPENYGFAKANNLVVEKSSAPYLFFVNPDCLFIENCLPALLDAMREAAICGPKVLNEDGSLQLSFGPFLSMPAEFKQQRRMKFEKSERVQKWIKTLGQTRVDYVSGCALMISSDVYKRVGGFDETFFLYEEDVDLCKRVHDLGLPTMYVPSAVIVHKRNQTVRTQQERSRKEYRKSQIYYYKKHHGWFQNALLKCYLFSRRKNV